MSYYDDDPPRRRKSHRNRDRDRAAYEDEVYESRGSRGAGAHQNALVRRPRDDDSDSIEEVHRDFPPGGGAYNKSRRHRRARSYDDDYHYNEPRRRRGGGRRRDYSSSSSSESPPRSRRKSLGEQALAALGVGGAAAAASRGKSRDRSRAGGRGRRRDSYSSSSRSRSRSADQKEKIQQAVKAALTAGAVEAFRSRKEPGPWTGDKGKRVLTAAIGAGGVNSALTSNRDPDKKDGRHGIQAVLGGLATNRLVNGGRDRSRSRSRHGRSGRDKKDSGGGLGGLAAGGIAAAAGKALLDARARSKSRGRRDSDSDDSRGPRNKKRSSSVGAYLEKGLGMGMAALGLKDDKKSHDSRRSRRYDDDDDDDYRYSKRGPPPTQGRLRGGGGDYGDGLKGGSSSSEDDISSSEEERTRKKMGRKELITAGLASVATIHAANSVYTSIEARSKRQKLVADGEMSPEESRKLKNKARLQDAASIGIAALGIKGAISEWKEMNEQRHECSEFDKKRKERHEKRLRKQEERMRLATNSHFTNSEPDLGRQHYASAYSPGYAPGQLRYQDDNPYHSGGPVQAPPMAWVVSAATPSCSNSLSPTNAVKPSVASGYQVALVATGLTKPRSIAFDTVGNLLVVESGTGISNLALQDDGGPCLGVKGRKVVIQNSGLNHGLALSQDGRTLYASTPEAAYSWSYDPAQSTVSETNRTLITNMNTEDHTTRTLMLSRKASDTLVVSRGSTSNIDLETVRISSGHSQLKAFDIKDVGNTGYDFNEDGILLGWGLRNSVGVVEHPDTGGIYSVENSVDEIMREGKNVHQDNPGEEMNFHGYLNGTEYAPQGSNYGYPYCFSAWAPEDLPQNENIKVGTQFAMGDQNNTINDTFCAGRTPPRLTFQAHMAPLDIKFNNSAAEAWVTFHGSWDRTNPVGYKLSVIPFANGEPVAAPDNKTAAIDVLVNTDNSKCPRGCFRPVGIAFDQHGRLFISSDSTGEIYVVVKDQTPQGTTGSTSGSAATPAASTAADRGLITAYSISILMALNIIAVSLIL
ncbi:MAG: hypothetical protein Q9213_006351 [Squamulea squamosa]